MIVDFQAVQKAKLPNIAQRMMFESARIMAETGVRLVLEAVELLKQSGDITAANNVLSGALTIHEEFEKGKRK